MAKPINIKEHNSSFVKFLIFFLVTLIMAVSAVYFNFRVPNKELAILRERSELLRNQQINQEKYKRTLGEVMAVLSKLDSASSNKAMVVSELTPKIDALNAAASIDDSTSSQRLNKMIFVLVKEYQKAKSDLYDLNDVDKAINDLKSENNTLRTRLKDCQDDANFRRAQ
jgi:Type VI secretion system, TssO